MRKNTEKSISDDRHATDTGNGKPAETHVKVSRRGFLGAMAALGGTPLLGTYKEASASEDFEGWPDRFGCLTDLTECVGCRSCERACNEANGLPEPDLPFDDESVFEEQRRPTEDCYTVVNRYENPDDPDRPIYRKVQCNHCNEPACASACPIHAYTKTPEGPVLYDEDKCFGCRYCMIACPFYVPAYDYDSLLEPKIRKCIMCYDRIKEGSIPACADACPTGAVTFGRRDQLLKLARKKIADNPDRYIDHIYGEREAGGTGWLYISGVPFDKVGLPTNLPKRPLIEETKGFLSAVPVVFTVWPALFGTIYTAMRHREGGGSEAENNEGKEGHDNG